MDRRDRADDDTAGFEQPRRRQARLGTAGRAALLGPRPGGPIDPDLPDEAEHPDDAPDQPERDEELPDPDAQRPRRAISGTIRGPRSRQPG